MSVLSRHRHRTPARQPQHSKRPAGPDLSPAQIIDRAFDRAEAHRQSPAAVPPGRPGRPRQEPAAATMAPQPSFTPRKAAPTAPLPRLSADASHTAIGRPYAPPAGAHPFDTPVRTETDRVLADRRFFGAPRITPLPPQTPRTARSSDWAQPRLSALVYPDPDSSGRAHGYEALMRQVSRITGTYTSLEDWREWPQPSAGAIEYPPARRGLAITAGGAL